MAYTEMLAAPAEAAAVPNYAPLLETAETAYYSGEATGAPMSCLIGYELDYVLTDEANPPTGQHVRVALSDEVRARRVELQNSRTRIAREIGSLTIANDHEAETRQRWLGQVEGLTLPELATYQVYAHLSRPTLSITKDFTPRVPKLLRTTDAQSTLDYRFGTDHFQAGWYDNGPEARTLPLAPAAALHAYQRTVDAFSHIAMYYGLRFGVLGTHINFSVWRRDKQGLHTVHSLSPGAELTESVNGAAGILLASRDATPGVVSYEERFRALSGGRYDANNIRTAYLRVLPDRFELRRSYGQHEDMALRTLATMSGFAYGSQEQNMEPQTVHAEYTPGFRPASEFAKDTDLHVLRALQHSTLAADGSFMLAANYAHARTNQIMRSFIGPVFDMEECRSFVAQGLLETMRLTSDGVLICDEQRFSQWLGSLTRETRDEISYANAHLSAAHINRRLQSVYYCGEQYKVCGEVPTTGTAFYKWPAMLQQLQKSPALRALIPENALAATALSRATWFAHT